MRSRQPSRHDPYCRGVLLLGLDARRPRSRPASSSPRAGRCARALPSAAPSSARRRSWMQGEIDDDTAVARMAATYSGLIEAWQRPHPLRHPPVVHPTACARGPFQ